MKSSAVLVAAMFLAVLCASCSIKVEPVAVSVRDIVAERPPGTIGPATPVEVGPWREIIVTFSKGLIKTLYKWESTFHVRLTDCGEGFVAAEDAYIGDASLNNLDTMHEEFSEFFDDLDDPVETIVYLSEEKFLNYANLCIGIRGGNILGRAIESPLTKVK